MAVTIADHGQRNRVVAPHDVLERQQGTIILDGDDNTVVLGEGAVLLGARIRLGSACSFTCGSGCRLASIEVHAALRGHVRIGDHTGFTWHSRLLLHEPGEIVLGPGCLIAGDTVLSVSDMHSVVDVQTGRRLNPAKNIHLGERVWLGEGVRVGKGVRIGDGSIIGAGAHVTKDVPPHAMAAGVPASVINTGVTWLHDLIPSDEVREHPEEAADTDAENAAVPTTPTAPTTAAGSGHSASAEDSLRFLVSRVARDPERFVTTIHPLDEVFLIGRNHLGNEETATLAYFRQGDWTADSLRQVAEWRFGAFEHVPRLLEFGCGYGRQTRFLLQEMPRERIWCSDIDPRAVDFVRDTFGVNTFASSWFPGGICCDERFELITALSVFSRLPRHTFVAALERLLALLAPGGVLVLSVNDELWSPPGTMSDEGFSFLPLARGTVDYGTSFVTERFVRRCLENAKVEGPACVRLPRGLCSHEDLYVVGRDATVPFADLRFRRGPEGYLGACERSASGQIELSGWIGDPDEPDGGAHVAVRLDGRSAGGCTTGLPRPDVAALLHEPLGPAAWASDPRGAMLEVEAVARDGRRRLLHAGRLGAVLNAKLV